MIILTDSTPCGISEMEDSKMYKGGSCTHMVNRWGKCLCALHSGHAVVDTQQTIERQSEIFTPEDIDLDPLIFGGHGQAGRVTWGRGTYQARGMRAQKNGEGRFMPSSPE